MTHDLIGSKEEIYNKLSQLEKQDFIKEFDRLMINGKWGSGKSYLIKAIKILAEENGINILVIDTWKLEYLTDPERMIMVELLSGRSLNVADELNKLFSEKFGKILKEYITTVGEDDTKVEKILKRGIKTFKYLKEDSNEAKYIELLDELSFNYLDEKLFAELNIDIIIFDELDRVLPETFIEIIKFIKYFKETGSSVKISAALNLEQCNSMIKHLYGEHFSSEVYLDKVFKNQMEVINYYREKAKYIYNIIKMPNKNKWDREYTIQQMICNYFVRGLSGYKDENVGFGFEMMELRDISNFVLEELSDFNKIVHWNNNEYESNLIKLMIIFYLMYNNKYYKNINESIYSELVQINTFPYKFKDEVIDIPVQITEEHLELIYNFKKTQKVTDIIETIDRF